MTPAFLYQIPTGIIVAFIFIGILVFFYVGKWLFNYQLEKNANLEHRGWGPLEGALLGILSLLLSFTFSRSSSNYSERRANDVREADRIHKVLTYTNMYSDSIKSEFRKDLKEYIKTRIEYFEAGIDKKRIKAATEKEEIILEHIFDRANKFLQIPTDVRSTLMMPAIGDMMEAATETEEARKAYTPEPILWLLILLCFAGIFIVGYTNRSHKADSVILFTYSAMTLMTIFIILDLDRPTRGLITTQSAQESIYALLKKI